jgi:hypothetical protein
VEGCEGLSLVREDRDGRTAGVPVVPPGAVLGSEVRKGEPLKASKWETRLKMNPPGVGNYPRRFLGDDQGDRLAVEGR